MKDQIPTEIAKIIQEKEQSLRAKHQAEEKQKLEKRNAFISQGRDMLELGIAATLLYVPKWLHPYDVTEKTFDDNDLRNIGERNQLEIGELQFHIPGLAPIQFKLEKVKETEPITLKWRSAQAYTDWREYGPAVPRLGFNNSSYWREDLEFVLVEAKKQLDEFEALTAEFKKQHEEESSRAEQQLKREEEADVHRVAERQEKESEELQLFNQIKNDPVVLTLLRAFQMINQERSVFASQIEDANESLYSMEEFWSRKSADLRRQADDAQRRAEEERYRLQSDLNDAEDKLSQTQKRLRAVSGSGY